jgi:hypothetical protein
LETFLRRLFYIKFSFINIILFYKLSVFLKTYFIHSGLFLSNIRKKKIQFLNLLLMISYMLTFFKVSQKLYSLIIFFNYLAFRAFVNINVFCKISKSWCKHCKNEFLKKMNVNSNNFRQHMYGFKINLKYVGI